MAGKSYSKGNMVRAPRYRLAAIFFLVFCLSLVFNAPALAAAETSFRLDIDSLNLQKGVSANLVVSMINARGAKVLRVEGLENFSQLSQSTSTSINISGRSTAYQEDARYTIIPGSAGQFTLKAIIQYNGMTYETNALEVTVSEGSTDDAKGESELFLKTILSKSDAYLGEKIVVTYELYSLYNIEDFGFTDYTSIDGAVVKEIPSDRLAAEYVYLDGVRYAKRVMKQLIIDPIKTGAYTIPSFNAQVNVIVEDWPGGFSGGGLGGLFGGMPGGFNLFNRSQAVYVQTEEKTLTVKPLPARGANAVFSGIVGELSVDGNVSRDALNYGDSLSLRAKLSGNCNLDGFKKLFKDGVPGFAVYETQKNAVESVFNNQYYAEKEFEVILVAEKTGHIKIEPLILTYFNPVSGRYEEAALPAFDIEVLGGPPSQASGAPLAGDGEGTGSPRSGGIETVLISQVSYMSDDDAFDIRISKRALYRALITLGALAALAFFSILLFISLKKRNTPLAALYRQAMKANDANEVFNLFNEMVKLKYNLSLKASSRSAVLSGAPNQDIAAGLTDILDFMESGAQKSCSILKEKIRRVFKGMR